MSLFESHQQAIRFAYALEAHPGDTGMSHSTMIRMALNEAGVTAAPAQLDKAALEELGAFAVKVLDAVSVGLVREESAVLVASYSYNWPARRAAVDVLVAHYRIPLTRHADDPRLIERLVTRHYLAGRERHRSWALADIAAEFRTTTGRATAVMHEIERLDRDLQRMAFVTLRARVDLPELEVAHG